MKTTLDIQDDLIERVRVLAQRERRTLRSVVEEALLTVLERRAAAQPYELPDHSVDGQGMAPEYVVGGWEAIAKEAYGSRGG